MRQSARQFVLPEPDAGQLADMVRRGHRRAAAKPYRRRRARSICGRILFGTTANIGAAATPAERGPADRAREPGLGLLCGRHEAAAHPGRR